MQVVVREERKPALVVALCIVAIGFILTSLSMVSMRMAYHRAYIEIASGCDRVSLIVVGQSKYFCAPVARLEVAVPQHEPTQSAVRSPSPVSGTRL
jgi:hypothetical protein